MSWTESRIEQLKTLWTRGLSASQIAEELGGVSRNAVIGKAHRLGLQGRPSPVKGSENEVAAETEATVAVELAPLAPSVPLSVHAPEPAPVVRPAPHGNARSAPIPTSETPAPAESRYTPPASALTGAQIGSIGPGGFLRQGPAEQLPPAQPAPPRRLVPAKPAAEIAGKTSLLDLNERICKWPLGHPGEPDFHFCGEKVNPGFPYCVTHCGHAYQAQMPRSGRKIPPPINFGGPRVR
ncbi:MAG: GcrA cell cycle regulator [Alphaproteobacteria bacterium]|nr:GcrA cell cycle regulator [Alphaproteobacteria bacterium]